MSGLDRQQALSALIMVITALFLGGFVAGRRQAVFRRLAIGLYGVAMVLALIWTAVWLTGW